MVYPKGIYRQPISTLQKSNNRIQAEATIAPVNQKVCRDQHPCLFVIDASIPVLKTPMMLTTACFFIVVIFVLFGLL